MTTETTKYGQYVVHKPIFFVHTSIAPKYYKAGEVMDTP